MAERFNMDEYDDGDLHRAAYSNDMELVKEMLLKGVNPNDISELDGCAALHDVAKWNKGDSLYDMAELLLKNGARVNAKDEAGITPFYILVKKANLRMIQLFLNFKNNVDVITYLGRNPLFAAVKHNRDVSVSKFLIDLGMDVKHQDIDGKTPLHWAAEHNEDDSHFKIFELLLKSGADPNARDKRKETPLHPLIKKSNFRTFNLFLSFKADVNVVNNLKENLLFPAVYRNENLEIVQLLLNFGLSADHQKFDGSTLLHESARYNYGHKTIKMVKFLLQIGGSPNAVDHNGFTPLAVLLNRVLNYSNRATSQEINFFVEQSDFNADSEYSSKLNWKLQNYCADYWKIVLEHLAKLDALNISIHPAMLDTILVNTQFHDYYKMCQDELLRAKSTKIQNTWITPFNLLVGDRKKLKNYAGNEDLVNNFRKNDYGKKFQIYGAEMNKNLSTGTDRRKLFDESSVILSNCLPIFNPNHLIIRDTLDCILSKKDLSKLCT